MVISERPPANTTTPAVSLARKLAALPPRVAFGGYTLQELDVMAEVLVVSGLMPNVTGKAQALMLMMKVGSTGLNPAEVYDMYDFIPGGERRPGQFRKKSLAVWAALAKLGGKIKRNHKWTSKEIHFTFSFPGSPDLEVKFSVAELERAGLITYYKGGKKVVREQWVRQGKNMLFYSAVREAAKFYAPWVVADVRLPSEMAAAPTQTLDRQEDMKEIVSQVQEVPAEVVPESEPDDEPEGVPNWDNEPQEGEDEPPPEADDNLGEEGPAGQREIS